MDRRSFLVGAAAVAVAPAIPLEEIAPFVKKIEPQALNEGLYRISRIVINFATPNLISMRLESVEVMGRFLEFTFEKDVQLNIGDLVRVQTLYPVADEGYENWSKLEDRNVYEV